MTRCEDCGTPNPVSWTPGSGRLPGVYLCLPCAASRFELGEERYFTSWAIVHRTGRQGLSGRVTS